jgi:single-strand DNA-binding protein
MSTSNITIVGNMTREPELRFTPGGQANIRFGVAVNRRWQDKASGEWQESTSFFDVVCWRELAENVSESLPKGARVVVTGRLEQRTYETTEGEKRNVVEIIADEVAPSLRWATARVEKTERKGASDGGGQRRREPQPAGPPPPAYGDDFGDDFSGEPF